MSLAGLAGYAAVAGPTLPALMCYSRVSVNSPQGSVAGFDPRAEVALEGAPSGAGDTPGPAGEVLAILPGDDRVDVSLLAARPAWLVLADTFAPGWEATLDGGDQQLSILRANAAFRAVRVPAGRHEVAMRYRAPGGAAGRWLALLAGGILAVWLVAGLLAGRRA